MKLKSNEKVIPSIDNNLICREEFKDCNSRSTTIFNSDSSEDKEASFFAVYDGHGGANVAQYAGCKAHEKIVNTAAYKKGDIENALRTGFMSIDEDMLKGMRERKRRNTMI